MRQNLPTGAPQAAELSAKRNAKPGANQFADLTKFAKLLSSVSPRSLRQAPGDPSASAARQRTHWP